MITFLRQIWKELTDPDRGLNPNDCIGLEVMAEYGECMGMAGTFWTPPQRAWITQKYSGKYGENFTVEWQFYGPQCVTRDYLHIRFAFKEEERIRPPMRHSGRVEIIRGVLIGHEDENGETQVKSIGNEEDPK